MTIILDTNPHAWALLAPTLPISAAIANLLVFINAHLAFNNSNKVAIIASHTQRAEFLYPISSQEGSLQANGSTQDSAHNGFDGDTEMADSNEGSGTAAADDANHYLPFRHIQTTLLSAMSKLYRTTSPESLTPTTSIAGALTLALTYINKQSIALSTTTSSKTSADPLVAPSDPNSITPATLNPRILILSVSGDLAHQYIPIMNTIFACKFASWIYHFPTRSCQLDANPKILQGQRLTIPIDICKIAGDSVFLQQASDATHGTYIALTHPRGLLQYLMLGFLPDQSSRKYLVPPTAVGVDFRAACFCHRKVVDVGFVCSICLSSKPDLCRISGSTMA